MIFHLPLEESLEKKIHFKLPLSLIEKGRRYPFGEINV